MRRTVIKLAVFGSVLAAVSFGVIVINQSAQLVALAGSMHPVAGRVLLWALVVFYAVCVVVPALIWLRLPRSLAAPKSDAGPEFDSHLAGLRRRLAVNPYVRERSLQTREEIEAAVKQLDGVADELSKQAASRVFLATAVSQNGSLDSLLVLGLQSRLVWGIAHVYRQRPSLRELGWLYANVVTTAFVAGEIEDMDLSQQIQPVVQNALGAAVGSVPGLQAAGTVVVSSIVTGTANAFLTLRVGVVARRYCGSMTRPDKSSLRRYAFAEAAAMLGAIVASGAAKIAGAIAKASGRTVTKTVSGIGARMKDGAGSVGSAVKSGTDAVVNTLSFRRKGDDAS